ncbi:MAG: McrB family protein [Chloroflexia bacterium]
MSEPTALETEATETLGRASAIRSRRGVSRTAWWLSTRRRRPEWQSLAGAGLATFSGRPRANFEQAQTGDPVLIYVARPDRAIRAVGTVTHVGAGPGEGGTGPADGASSRKQTLHIEVQFAFEVPNPLPWQEIQAVPGLEEAEPVKQRSSGTLFYLSPTEYAILQQRLVARNPELASAFAAIEAGEHVSLEPDYASSELPSLREQPPGYLIPSTSPTGSASSLPSSYRGEVGRPALPPVADIAALQEMTGLPAVELEEARDLLEDTGGIVLGGPPGTGKTWLARGLGALVAGDPARAQVVQFHPATTYEDFIEGLKPSVDVWGHVTYAVMPGLFVRMCDAARRDPDHPYVLIIDEINRAPLARVFGELLYALEYRGPGGAVELSVSAGIGTPPKPFYVPENLLLIGTMNSADRSLALVDYALRRRFRFLQVEPNAEVLDAWLREHGTGKEARTVLLDLFRDINARLSEALDPDHRLGHSYFMLEPLTPATLDLLWRTAIRPLIAEYFIPPAGEVEEYAALFAAASAALNKADG